MPVLETPACSFMWSVHRPMKIGTGSELPDACFMWQASGKPSLHYRIAVPIIGKQLCSGHSCRNVSQSVALLVYMLPCLCPFLVSQIDVEIRT